MSKKYPNRPISLDEWPVSLDEWPDGLTGDDVADARHEIDSLRATIASLEAENAELKSKWVDTMGKEFTDIIAQLAEALQRGDAMANEFWGSRASIADDWREFRKNL